MKCMRGSGRLRSSSSDREQNVRPPIERPLQRRNVWRRNRKLLLFNDAHHLSLHTNRVSAYAPSEEYSFVTLVQEDVADAHICPRLPGAHSR